jgi:hypothetical protein
VDDIAGLVVGDGFGGDAVDNRALAMAVAPLITGRADALDERH